MNETQVADIWLLLKEYVDPKLIETISERYIDLLADHGVTDKTIRDSMGYDEALDIAIEYYFDGDIEEESWDE